MRISDWSSDVCSSDLGDKGARITAFQVHLHDDAPLAILAADLVQAFGDTDLRDLGERNLPPQTAFLRKQDRNHADVVEVDARGIWDANRDVEAPVAIVEQAGLANTERRRKGDCDLLDRKTVTRNRIAIELKDEGR